MVHKTYPGFGLVDVSEKQLSPKCTDFSGNNICSARLNAFHSDDHSDDNRYSLARFVVSDALAPRNENQTLCTDYSHDADEWGLIYQTLDGKTPSGPLISAGALIAQSDIHICAASRVEEAKTYFIS